jgi:hypothetical protein
MRLRIALVTAAIGLAAPAAASADTFCVNKPPCLLGTTEDTMQEALDAAEQDPGPEWCVSGPVRSPTRAPSLTTGSPARVTLRFTSARSERRKRIGPRAAPTRAST